jgi:uncharacterized protein YebE (UPF0316 family)
MKIIGDPILSSVCIFISQLIFVYLRTLNVIYTSKKNVVGAVVTGNGLALVWLISIAIGTHSIMNGEILPIISFLIGGTIGTYLGIKKEISKKD